jgi:hypothetical protein
VLDSRRKGIAIGENAQAFVCKHLRFPAQTANSTRPHRPARKAWLRAHMAAGGLDLPSLPLNGDAATHIIRYASRPTQVRGKLPGCASQNDHMSQLRFVLRVTQRARGSTTLIYDVNDWQRRCWRGDLGSPVMCLVQHGPHKPN